MPTRAWMIVQTNNIQTTAMRETGGEEMSSTRNMEIIIIKYRKVNKI